MFRLRLPRFVPGSLLTLSLLASCAKSEPPAPARPSGSAAQAVGRPELPAELSRRPPAPRGDSAGAPAPATTPAAPTAWSARPAYPPDYQGAWFAVTAQAAGVYVEPNFDSKKLGYMRHGSRIPVNAAPVSKKNCTGGWYAAVSGGFVCGNLGTTDLNHPEVKFSGRTPNLDEVLPYPYARNAKHGTPLYRTVPSREQMERYEPYLLEKKAKEEEIAVSRAVQRTPDATERTIRELPDAGAPAAPPNLAAAMADAGLINASIATDPAPDKPWWQREDIKDRLHEVKLEHLESDADDVLAKRMVTGFYVAVDKTFRWNGRAWYKTTKGLVTPSERFWQTTGSKFKGVELDGAQFKLPLAWVYGGRKNAGTYTIDPATRRIENASTVERFAVVQLTGKSVEVGRTHYEELADGTWIKRSHVRKTSPGPLPSGLGPSERWIDVNLKTQTLVAFSGETPIYATLISSGKESKIEEKDHRTPVGEWRIREKHITTTMDGDGSAAGDLPYSIEDVPYAMFYHRAYAVHGAFWHSNFGVQMSHGCVNLAPLDAKYLFFFADPPLPAGLHGVWANDASPGSRVVVHE